LEASTFALRELAGRLTCSSVEVGVAANRSAFATLPLAA
jgi:hypothetical protein